MNPLRAFCVVLPCSSPVGAHVSCALLRHHWGRRGAGLQRPGCLAPCHLQVVQKRHPAPRGSQEVPRVQELHLLAEPYHRKPGEALLLLTFLLLTLLLLRLSFLFMNFFCQQQESVCVCGG